MPSDFLPQRLQRPDPHGENRRKQTSYTSHHQRKQHAQHEDAGVHDHLQDDALATAHAAADEARRGLAVTQRPDGAAQHATYDRQQQRLEEKRNEYLPATEADDPQHADVLAPLADGREHDDHDADDAADRHEEHNNADRKKELLVRGVELLVVVRFGL